MIKFETAKLAKKKGFDVECLKFYTKPKSKMFGIDEHGRSYPMYNKSKSLYTIGSATALNIENVYFAPTQSVLLRWLREVRNIDVVISPERYEDGINYMVQAQKWDLKVDKEIYPNFVIDGSYWFNDNHEYPTYEKALEKGLQEALKLIK